jgi:nitroreductase
MTRDFLDRPLAPGTLDALLDLARRSPAAGNTAALAWLVLEGDDAARYWDVTLPAPRRAAFPWPGLLRAPALVLPWVRPGAYVERYAEADKADTGLGVGGEAWPTPYWWVDGGMAAMVVLLAAEARGLGALFFGLFGHEAAVRHTFGVPEDRRAIGAIAVGHPAPEQRASGSSRRGRPPLPEVVHRGGWIGVGRAEPR